METAIVALRRFSGLAAAAPMTRQEKI